LVDIIDISLPLHPDMPVWPGSGAFRLHRTESLEAGDEYNVSRLECDLHTGSHVDAPWHCLEDGRTVEHLPLDTLIGAAVVAYLPEAEAVTADDLVSLGIAPGTKRLLLRTRNSELWAAGATEFTNEYVALTADAAQWVVEHDIRLVGVDYFSVQQYNDDSLTHQILLRANVIVLEGLNLAGVRPGEYELICLPLKLVGAEGAPVRAVLRPLPLRSDQPSHGREQ
jgi:arylformamidase